MGSARDRVAEHRGGGGRGARGIRDCKRAPRATRPPPAAPRPRPPRPPRGRRRAAVGADDRARGGHQAAGRVVRERGSEVLDPAALGAHAGAAGTRPRHQLAQPREQPGLGRAGHRANATRGRCRPRGPRRARRRAPPGARGAAGRRSSWISAAPGFDVRTSTKHAAPAVGRRVDERLERVAAEQRIGRERVGAEPRHVPERPGVSPTSAWAYAARGDRHVAALAVGDHQQAVAARGGRRRLERPPARRPQALEAGELELDRHARRPGRLDRRAAVPRDRVRGGRGGIAVPGPGLDRAGHSAAGSGSSPRTTRLRRPSTSAASRSPKCLKPEFPQAPG